MQPSSSAPSQTLPPQPQSRHHGQQPPSSNAAQQQQPPEVFSQPKGKLQQESDLPVQTGRVEQCEIQPPTSPVQPADGTLTNAGWLAQTQDWAAAVWSREVR